MGLNENKGISFSGFNIETLEKDLAIKLPASGDAGIKKEIPDPEKKGEDDVIKKSLANNLGFNVNQMIEIPDTPEELAAAKTSKTDDGGSPGKETKNIDARGEDAIIKEDSPLYLHAATLYEEGILPTLDLKSIKDKPFKEGMQAFRDAQKKYFEDGRNEYQNSLTDRQKEFLEMIETGIPQEQVEHQFTIEDSYGKITDEILSDDTQLQKDLIVQNYKLKGISDKKIDIFIKAAENDERLYEESKESLSDINNYIAEQKKASLETARQQQASKDQDEKDLEAKIKTTIEGTTEILPGIPLSASEKTKLNDYMTKPVEERVINGRKIPIDIITKTRLKDPIDFNLRTAYFITLGLFDKNADLSKFVKKTTTTAADRLTNILKESPDGTEGLKIEKRETGGQPKKIIFPQNLM